MTMLEVICFFFSDQSQPQLSIESKLRLTLDASLWGVQSGLPLLFGPCVRLDLNGE